MNTRFEVTNAIGEKSSFEYCRYPDEGYQGERIVEIPIAFNWLSQLGTGNLIEIGAVMPAWITRYDMEIVWPVYDPYDLCPIAIRKSALDIDYTGKDVLSISTIEHIGRPDYGAPEMAPETACHAFDMIYWNSRHCLITVPIGYNQTLDGHMHQVNPPCFMMRQTKSTEEWQQIDVNEAAWKARYGHPFPLGNVVVFVMK